MPLPIPTIQLHDIYQLTPETLRELGVRFLMMDLDNTLAPYHIHTADPRLAEWIASLRGAGIEPFILSNNRGDRPARFAAQLGVDYVNRAKKPGIRTAMRIMRERGYLPEETAIVGDQIYTDVLCAARCGVKSICVRPICISRNPLLAARYFLELPFRGGRKNGQNK